MDRVSKSGITYDKVKTIFNEIVKSANIIASEKPSNNRICYEKYFLIWEKFLLESFTALKFLMINIRSRNVELKNKADDKQSTLETQNEPLSLTKKKNQNLKTVSLKEENYESKNLMNNQTLQTCLIQKVKNLQHSEEVNKEKALKF